MYNDEKEQLRKYEKKTKVTLEIMKKNTLEKMIKSEDG